MAVFVSVAKVSDIQPGQSKTVYVDGKSIAVFNVDGAFYAIGVAPSEALSKRSAGQLHGAGR